NAAETFREAFGVAVIASGADLGAAGDRIPSGISPFNCGPVCHSRSGTKREHTMLRHGEESTKSVDEVCGARGLGMRATKAFSRARNAATACHRDPEALARSHAAQSYSRPRAPSRKLRNVIE